MRQRQLKQPARSEAMKGKPGRNPRGRPTKKRIELILEGTGDDVIATLIEDGKVMKGDPELAKVLYKARQSRYYKRKGN